MSEVRPSLYNSTGPLEGKGKEGYIQPEYHHAPSWASAASASRRTQQPGIVFVVQSHQVSREASKHCTASHRSRICHNVPGVRPGVRIYVCCPVQVICMIWCIIRCELCVAAGQRNAGNEVCEESYNGVLCAAIELAISPV